MHTWGRPPVRFVRLTPREDAYLREIEQNTHLKPDMRLRAQVLRLLGRGESVGSIIAYAGRSEASFLRDKTAGRSAALRAWPRDGTGQPADGQCYPDAS